MFEVPDRSQTVDGVELERGDRPVDVFLQDDDIEDADGCPPHQLGQRHRQRTQRLDGRHGDDDVLDEVGRRCFGGSLGTGRFLH